MTTAVFLLAFTILGAAWTVALTMIGKALYAIANAIRFHATTRAMDLHHPGRNEPPAGPSGVSLNPTTGMR